MKKIISLFVTFFIIFSVFAVDNSYDVQFSLGYAKFNANNNKINNPYSSDFDSFEIGAGVDIFWNPIPVGFYCRIEPLILNSYDRSLFGKSEKFKGSESSNIGLAEDIGAVYALELGDYFYINFATGISIFMLSSENKSNDDRIRLDSIMTAGFVGDINLKFVYNGFIASAGIKGAVYPKTEATVIDSNYDDFKEDVFSCSYRPYISLGFRIRHIRVN